MKFLGKIGGLCTSIWLLVGCGSGSAIHHLDTNDPLSKQLDAPRVEAPGLPASPEEERVTREKGDRVTRERIDTLKNQMKGSPRSELEQPIP